MFNRYIFIILAIMFLNVSGQSSYAEVSYRQRQQQSQEIEKNFQVK